MPTLKSWALNTTKLHRPGLVPDLVTRPRLLAELERGLAGSLTLVCASAGYGKTMLVSSWLESRAAGFAGPGRAMLSAWLSLDEYDSDLTAFLYYFCAALRTIFPGACPQTLALLQASEEAPLQAFSATLSNELAGLPEDFILVLDDYQSISGVQVPDLLAALARHWPRPLHLILITRRNPPLPLAGLRARGRLTEIRTRDLRFTTEEMAQYLTGVLGEPPSELVLAQLAEQTEGWIIGLRLATLSLPKDAEPASLSALAEADTNIADYLVEELLAQQPADILSFLLQTSLLDRFCVPLCDQAIERSPNGRDARACLEWLERTNFLIVVLDDRREWRRYHHLVQDLLRERAAVELGAERCVELHRRAAAWFLQQGSIEEALQQALAAHDLEQAAELMEKGVREVINREDLVTIRRWLRLLPDELRLRRPGLLLMEAWSLALTLRLGELAELLQRIETVIAGDLGKPADAEARIVRGQFLALSAPAALFRNQPARCLAYVEEALSLLPESWTGARGLCLLYLGLSSQALGRGEAANRLLWARYAAAPGKSDAYGLRILCALCLNALESGQLEQARQIAVLILAQGRRNGQALLGSAAHAWLGQVYYEWDELDAAREHFQAAVQDYSGFVNTGERQALLGTLRVQLAAGDTAGAWETLELISRHDMDQLGYEPSATLSVRARLQHASGNALGAWRWADAFTAPVPDEPLYAPENAHMSRAQLLIARGDPADISTALQTIDALYQIATRTHSTRVRIRLLALRALALSAQRQEAAAQVALGQALVLARPGGFIRTFVDLGPRMEALLNRRVEHGVAAEALCRILAAFPTPRNGSQPPGSQPLFALPETLTERELDIVRLLRERLSDKEIAERLVIVPGTVRSHLTNLYGKLGVNRRRDAVAKAEALGILPPR